MPLAQYFWYGGASQYAQFHGWRRILSEVRARLADNAPIASFRDLAGYFSLVVLCRTYTKLSD